MKCAKLMIQGTASSSGKSLVAAALCRIFWQDGYRVAPFKAQNMSNNSFVTADGLEMGRAQVVQAYAAGLLPDVRMNPVLIKPSCDTGAQVVLKGKPAFTMNACQWHQTSEKLKATVKECYQSIIQDYELLVIEGAGSPAEINLKKNDIVNMGMAKMADAPVIIVGDIDRGGVFASLVGTMQLLEPDERMRVKGFIINKFRGDVELLKPGLEQLIAITGVPVLGVIPWVDHAIDDEDGVTERFNSDTHHGKETEIDICIIRLPHISNFTDFLPLESIPGVGVRWCTRAEMIGNLDLLIIPGTKTTINDLRALKEAGIAEAIEVYARNGGRVLGICGGFQMLGCTVSDDSMIESTVQHEDGLNLLPMTTCFVPQKRTVQTRVRVVGRDNTLFSGSDFKDISGYEIHMGISEYDKNAIPFTILFDNNGSEKICGITDQTGRISGTYIHGIFDSGAVVNHLINRLRQIKGLAPLDIETDDRTATFEKEINRLAAVCRQNLDLNRIVEIMHSSLAEVNK